ncbi:MAG: sugar ABC transporter permease, partial [Ktedonobacteraceae bacterium]|nr:sugar ABC transporter permease [Ktedonobacteraceae bacterium]
MQEKLANAVTSSEGRVAVGTPADAGKKRRPYPSTKRKRIRWKQILQAYLFIAPFCLVFLLFNLGPDIYSLALSFERYAG